MHANLHRKNAKKYIVLKFKIMYRKQ